MTEEVFLGLGGNIGDTATVMLWATKRLAQEAGIYDVQLSPLYHTSPVSDIPQRNFVNGVCRLKTSLEPLELFHRIKSIESEMGRHEVVRNAPRIIDIDILFFGQREVMLPELYIPHPRWHERLFVLRPLADLTSSITLLDGQVRNLDAMIAAFPLASEQKIWPLVDKVGSV